MREIKFRFVKEKDLAGPFELGHKSIPYYIENGYTPLQYTGLKDKNGVEIYEGDIVKIDTGTIFQVVSLNINSGFELYNPKHKWYYETRRTEIVIGNIYENLELLK